MVVKLNNSQVKFYYKIFYTSRKLKGYNILNLWKLIKSKSKKTFNIVMTKRSLQYSWNEKNLLNIKKKGWTKQK